MPSAVEGEPTLDFPRILRGLDERMVRYVVIGGQAVILHGIPLLTFDFDLWIDPAVRREVLAWLEDGEHLELSSPSDGTAPIVRALAGNERLDMFFVKAMTNRVGITVTFDDVYERAASGISVRQVRPSSSLRWMSGLSSPPLRMVSTARRMPHAVGAGDGHFSSRSTSATTISSKVGHCSGSYEVQP